jgi:GNAT superfamily N-acetyltransferase
VTGIEALLDATWPAASVTRAGPFTLREGRGGGSRVSAATLAAPWTEGDIAGAERAMEALGQAPIFMIRPGEEALDAALGARGFRIADPVVIWQGGNAAIAGPAPAPFAAFPVWPPLAVMRDLWAEGQVGSARLEVMSRVNGPKTALLGRRDDRAAGVAFVAADGRQAMLHALFVPEAFRRRGVGRALVRAAAQWAGLAGAETLVLAVTRANLPANVLYASLGMTIVGQYHYRMK